MFNFVKRAAKAVSREAAAEYGQNKDFLEGVCAAAALVSAADGEIEDAERTKVIAVISGHKTLGAIYSQNDIQTVADEMFKRAKDGSGRIQLARELDDVRSKPNGRHMAEDIYAIARDIASADGEVEPKEQEVLAKIASRLQVDPKAFDF